jgi:polyisoprenoid-binding protein YceI
MFSLVKDLPVMFGIITTTWFLVAIIVLMHLLKRTDISKQNKIVWVIVGLIPIFGIGAYSIANFRKNKFILITFVFAIIITISSVWYYGIYLQSPAKTDRTAEPGIGISADSLMNEFYTNEAAANKKYNNKLLEITGIIAKSENNPNTILFLKTNFQDGFVSANLKEKKSLPIGSTVTVKGIFTGFILGEIQLTEAVVLNPNTTPSNSPITTNKNPDTTVSKKDTIILPSVAKVFKSTTGSIRFFSKTPAEDIEATNKQLISSINASTGEIKFAALIKGFQFENQLMQKHFNEPDYLNSDSFPKSEFKGKIKNITSVDFTKNGTYAVTADGQLSIHGVTKKIEVAGQLIVNNGTINLKSIFKIHVQDYRIDGNDVADLLDVTVNCTYK